MRDIVRGNLPREADSVVLVVGVHRSGSSAWTRGLQAIGFGLGENLMPPVADNNERGFFEDLDFNRMNDKVLRKLGSAWHRLDRFNESSMSGAHLYQERLEAFQMVAEKVAKPGRFAFKDPRSAILLPFWKNVLGDLSCDLRYVVPLRSPLDVALSLNRRDGFEIERGVHLWARYMVATVAQMVGEHFVVGAYDNLIADPAGQLARVADALGVPIDPDMKEALTIFSEDFLDEGLRHSVTGSGELRRSGVVPPYVVDLYEMLSDLAQSAHGQQVEIDQERWSRIECRHFEAVPGAVYADHLLEASVKIKDEASSLRKYKEEAEIQLNRLGERIASADRKWLDAKAKIKERATEIDSLTVAAEAAVSETEILRRTIEEIQASKSNLERELRQVQFAAENKIADLIATGAQQKQDIDNLEKKLGHERVESECKNAEVNQLSERLDAVRRGLTEVRASKKAVEKELSHAREAGGKEVDELIEAQALQRAELESLKKQLDAERASNSDMLGAVVALEKQSRGKTVEMRMLRNRIWNAKNRSCLRPYFSKIVAGRMAVLR